MYGYASFYPSASFIRVKRRSCFSSRVCGRRGSVVSFSSASRRRMMNLLNKIKISAFEHFVFATFTFHHPLASSEEYRRVFHRFFVSLRKRCKGFIWRIEFQKRGVPHLHILIYSLNSSFDDVVNLWLTSSCQADDRDAVDFHFGRIPGSRFCIEPLHNKKKAMKYASKYCAKDDEVSFGFLGRRWGYWGDIPFSSCVTIEIPDAASFNNFLRCLRARLSKLHIRNHRIRSFYLSPAFYIVYLDYLIDFYSSPPDPPFWLSLESAIRYSSEIDVF